MRYRERNVLLKGSLPALKTCARNANVFTCSSFTDNAAYVDDRLLHGGRSSPSALSPAQARKRA
jgi:hypothetical protein